MLKDIAGLEMTVDCPFVGYRKLDSEQGDTNVNNILSTGTLIRHTNQVTSDDIPE